MHPYNALKLFKFESIPRSEHLLFCKTRKTESILTPELRTPTCNRNTRAWRQAIHSVLKNSSIGGEEIQLCGARWQICGHFSLQWWSCWNIWKITSKNQISLKFKKKAYPHSTFSKHKLSDFENKLLTDANSKILL